MISAVDFNKGLAGLLSLISQLLQHAGKFLGRFRFKVAKFFFSLQPDAQAVGV